MAGEDRFTPWLLQEAGTWSADVVVYVGPGAPSRSEGVLVADVAGRFLRTRFDNATSGFNGAGLYGFDSLQGRPVAVWVDTQTSFVSPGKGSFDEDRGVVVYEFAADLPGRGPMRWREVHARVSVDEKRFDSYFEKPDGGELHIMSITYRRRS